MRVGTVRWILRTREIYLGRRKFRKGNLTVRCGVEGAEDTSVAMHEGVSNTHFAVNINLHSLVNVAGRRAFCEKSTMQFDRSSLTGYNEFNLNGAVTGQFCDTNSRACVYSSYTENVPKQVRDSVGHDRLTVKSLSRCYEHDDLQDLPDLVERTQSVIQGGESVESREAGRFLGLLFSHRAANLSRMENDITGFGHVPTDVGDTAMLYDGLVCP